MKDREAALRDMYGHFNRRDIDDVLRALHDDVVWANGMDGGYAQGKAEVREYWSRQWLEVSPHVEPLVIETLPSGDVAVEVRQSLRDLDGRPLASAKGLGSEIVRHVFRFAGDHVVRFDIEKDGGHVAA